MLEENLEPFGERLDKLGCTCLRYFEHMLEQDQEWSCLIEVELIEAFKHNLEAIDEARLAVVAMVDISLGEGDGCARFVRA